MSGTQRLLARIKALFEPRRATAPAPQDAATPIPAEPAPETAEAQTAQRLPLFEEFPPSEEAPASAVGVVLLISVFAIFLAVSRFIPLDRVLGQK